ncbi:MAG: acyltransferase [Patescibacteria group bacterium]
MKSATLRAENFVFISILRGLAALLVVWSHLSGFWLYSIGESSGLQNIWEQWVTGPFRLLFNGGDMAVIIFFLISGFIITHVSFRETRFAFAVKRIMRIFPPLFVAILVSYVAYRLALKFNLYLPGIHGEGLWHWIKSLFLLDGFYQKDRALNVTWTLVVEIYFYILTWYFLKTTKKSVLKSQWAMTGVWALLASVTVSVGFIGQIPNASQLKMVAFLLIGRGIYLLYSKRISSFDMIFNSIVVSFIYLLDTEHSKSGFLLTPGYEPVVGYIIAILIFIGMLRLSPSSLSKPLKFLADISYSLYLIHLPLGILALNFLHKRHISNSLSSVIAVVVSIFGAYILYKAVEKPSQKYARKIINSSKFKKFSLI